MMMRVAYSNNFQWLLILCLHPWSTSWSTSNAHWGCCGFSQQTQQQQQPPRKQQQKSPANKPKRRRPPRIWPPRRERFLQDYIVNDNDDDDDKCYYYFSYPPGPTQWPFTIDDFKREDEEDDTNFYEDPKFARHVDEWALLSLKRFYGEEIDSLLQQQQQSSSSSSSSERIQILDLCSSWMSHLPESITNTSGTSSSSSSSSINVTGLGMNAKELEENPQLNRWLLQDLNSNPTLPFEDDTFDLVLNTCSVDYLTNPKQVFEEVHRITKPGGLALVSFSNRYYRSKAVRCWLLANDEGRQHIVASYFYHTAKWESIVALNIKLQRSIDTISEFVFNPNYSILRWLGGAVVRDTFETDPIYVVKAVKKEVNAKHPF